MAPEGYENASPPDERLESARRLFDNGFDVSIRLSPFVPQFVDLGRIIESPVNKVLVEFLRINTFIQRNLPTLDTSQWIEKSGNYRHLPLWLKMKYLLPLIQSGKRVSVCEDHPEHYEHFKRNVNPNPEDCCDLRL